MAIKRIHIIFLLAINVLTLCVIGIAFAHDRITKPLSVVLQPDEIYATTAAAVHTLKLEGSYGSAIAVTEDVLATNCHVLSRGQTVFVDGQPKLLQVINSDYKVFDLCFIYVADMHFKSVNIRTTSDVKIGEKAYAIGNPLGYDKTLSQGLISNKSKHDGHDRLQISAPISPGSSGGGLFDERANLIGITSSSITTAANISFAEPTDPILAALQQKKLLVSDVLRANADKFAKANQIINKFAEDDDGPDIIAALQSCSAENIYCAFYLGEIYYWKKQYKLAFPLLQRASAHNIEKAYYFLSLMYETGSGVQKNLSKAIENAQQAAMLGDQTSAYGLGLYYYKLANDNLKKGHKSQYKENLKQSFAWFKVAAIMGQTVKQKGEVVELRQMLGPMQSQVDKQGLTAAVEEMTNEICSNITRCVRYDF